ncbi:MAG TPA: low-specificity L-threonine aldolase [Acidobacteriota bacterium]|nr:low-specificity L-threonine aldolase [Acidobacteriota bacterium]
MDNSVIDLRSDTVTRPTAEMRAAMAAAEVGDDVYMDDPTVNRLQDRAAEIFKKEAALFVPSGTMGNQVAIRVHTNPGQEVITEGSAHIYEFEMAAMAVISGTLARPIPSSEGILEWEDIRKVIRPKIYYRAQTGLIALENTHNMAGGTLYPKERIDDICNKAHEAGLPVHMDGARIFNAATALNIDVASLVRNCDSVMFCLSKGLSAPVGSLLVGSRSFIERARSVRKLLGGGMRQVGVLAAAGLIALEKMPARLGEDHRNARLMADLLHNIPELDVKPEGVLTNIMMVGTSRTGLESSDLVGRLREKKVLVSALDAARLRLVTHNDVSREQIYLAAEAFAQCMRKA